MSISDRHKDLVYTIKELCRVCYTCVRECPAKAIKIINGQAEVLSERCIGCGNCIKVCSQDAKVFQQSRLEVRDLLKSAHRVVAIVAPSFPASFPDIHDYKSFVGMVRALGFDHVCEVAFGADLVARRYKQYLEEKSGVGFISSDCPAIVDYVRYYHPQLVDNLIPVVSPMMAMAKVVRETYGSDVKVVFVGPCIAKKNESFEVDEVITFRELHTMFDLDRINAGSVTPSDFDPPKAGRGAIFPITRGLIQTVNISDDIFEGNVIVADGRANFQQAIKEFESGNIKNVNLELLCCEGCIMGPGMPPGGSPFERRAHISNYVRNKLDDKDDMLKWQTNIEHFANSVDLSITFTAFDQRTTRPMEEEVGKVLASMGKFTARDHLNCGACGYDTCMEHAVAIVEGLAEVEMCLPYTIEELHSTIKNLAISNEKLATMQQALRQNEKLAHMGQLSAGIAHELNNPLGVLIMYSNILLEECKENDPNRQDLELIATQAERCKKIVGGLLNFARKNQVRFEDVDIVKMVDDSLSSVVIPSKVSTRIVSKIENPKAILDYDQMMQVLTNLNKNAIEAMPGGGVLEVAIEDTPEVVIFRISDTGVGITDVNMDKLFTPFFTTKEVGKGTGLGLATSYGIVKMHRGKIDVKSNADKEKGPTGTTFSVILPRKP